MFQLLKILFFRLPIFFPYFTIIFIKNLPSFLSVQYVRGTLEISYNKQENQKYFIVFKIRVLKLLFKIALNKVERNV